MSTLRQLLLWFFEYSPPFILGGMILFSVIAAWPGWDRDDDERL